MIQKAKPGRPKLPEQKTYKVVVRVRLTKPQYKAYQRLATDAGLTLSAWVRRTLAVVFGE